MIHDWIIDGDNELTLNNLVGQYELWCTSHLTISAIGMAYFAGFAIGALILPGLSDKYGRKRFFLAGLFLQFLSVLTCVLLPGGEMSYFNVMVFMWFLLGIS